MNLQQLEYFVLLAEKEHMTNAAKELNTSQPNLSYAMNELEKELGVPLFKRSGRNIQLTRFGSIFYKKIKPALQQIVKAEQIISDMINPTNGLIRFGFIYTMGAYIAPQLVSSFRQIEENSQVAFSFKQGNSTTLVEDLLNEKLDIILTSYIENSDAIHYEALYKEQLILVVPENHPLASQNMVYLKDVINHQFVYFKKSSGLRSFLDNVFQQFDLTVDIAMEVEEDHTVLGFVGHNYGIAIMPDIQSIDAFPVKKIAIIDNIPSRWIYLACRKDDFLSPTNKRFFKHALEQKSILNNT